MDLSGSLFWWIDQWEKSEQDYVCSLIEYYPDNTKIPVPYGIGRIKAEFLRIKTGFIIRENCSMSDNKDYVNQNPIGYITSTKGRNFRKNKAKSST